MTRKTLATLLIPLAVLAACRSGKNLPAAADDSVRPFKMVEIPALIDSQEAFSEYLLDHYWDNVLDTSKTGFRCDSLYIAGIEKSDFEQAFSNFTLVLDGNPVKNSYRAMEKLYRRAQLYDRVDTAANLFISLVEIGERYLYDPNSPVRNEEYFLACARAAAASESLSDVEREKFARFAQRCSLNRPGTKAADFVFTDKNGRNRSLYSVKADYTILFFSNPGCKACKEIIETLNGNEWLEGMIEDGNIAVVNVYIDEDVAAWRSYMPIYSEKWYNGYDANLTVRSEDLYDVRAIPSLYLLDRDKNVILKDAPEDRFYGYLQKLQ